MSFYETIYDTLRAQDENAAPRVTALVLQSRAAGRRLLAALAAHCGALIGVSAETPYSLAADVCAEALSAPGAPRLMDDDEAAELLLTCIYKANGTFTGESAGSPAAARELYRTLTELELEQIPSLTEPGKQADLQALREAYAAEKENRNCIDRADLFALAIKDAPKHPVRVVTLPTLRFSAQERKLLAALNGAEPEIVPLAVPAGFRMPGVELDGLPASDPLQNRNAANTRIVNCMGVDVEVDRVFRDILDKQYPPDSCAVVYCSGSYVPLLYEAAGCWGVPVSMSSGIPIEQTRLCAALRRLAELPRRFYDAERIRELLTQYGCLSIATPYCDRETMDTASLHSAGAGHLAAALRDYRVGWGDKAKYMDFIARYREAVSANDKLEQKQKDAYLAQSEIWRAWLEDVFLLTDSKYKGLETQRAAMLRFLDSFTKRAAAERSAVAAAADAARHVRSIPSGETLLAWLNHLLFERSVLAENACPGKLFCLPIRQGYLACREHIYVLGLGHDVFSDARESAVLLDDERRALSPSLTPGSAAGKEKLFRFEELLLHHDGDLILSYPGYDCARQQALEDAQALEQVKKALGLTPEKSSYIPDKPRFACDDMITLERTETAGLPVFPGDGEMELKDVPSFADWLRDYEFSPSSVEAALRCPFVFYIRYVLGARKDTLPRWRMDRWLESNARGTAVHDVLDRYYTALRENPSLNTKAAQDAKLEEIFKARWEQCVRENPPEYAKAVVDREETVQRAMVRAAVEWTEAQKRDVIETEQTFGGDGPKVELTLGKHKMNLLGKIDRLDLCGAQTPQAHYAVLDYKTGDPERQEKNKDYHLQHYLYAEAERAISNGAVDPKEAGYLMLAGEEAVYLKADEADNKNAAAVVEALLDQIETEETCLEALPWLARDGELIDLNDNVMGDARLGLWKDCDRFCVYREICPIRTEMEKKREGDS